MPKKDYERLEDLSDVLAFFASYLIVHTKFIMPKIKKTSFDILSVYLNAIANFFDLASAIQLYDDYLNSTQSKENNILKKSALEDLVTSRFFSCIGSVYFIKYVHKELQTLDAEIDI